MGDYRVARCEDTGKPALYHRIKTDHEMWLLVAHEPDFAAIAEALVTAIARRDAEAFLTKHKLGPLSPEEAAYVRGLEGVPK